MVGDLPKQARLFGSGQLIGTILLPVFDNCVSCQTGGEVSVKFSGQIARRQKCQGLGRCWHTLSPFWVGWVMSILTYNNRNMTKCRL